MLLRSVEFQGLVRCPILTLAPTPPWPGGANIAKTAPATRLMGNAMYKSDLGLSSAINVNGGYITKLIFENQKSKLVYIS